MSIFEWKKIAVPDASRQYLSNRNPYPWPDFVIAVIIPIATPHSAGKIPAELLQQIEILQLFAFSTTYHGKKASLLPKASAAILKKQSDILAVCRSEEKLELGTWLQKYAPWDSDKQLLVADTGNFHLRMVTPTGQNTKFDLCLDAEVAFDTNNWPAMWRGWLHSQSFVHLWDIHEVLEVYWKNSDLFLYPPEEIRKNRLRQEQFEKKARQQIERQLASSGLKLNNLKVEWLPVNQLAAVAAQKTKEGSPLDQNVEHMEQLRLSQDLWDARYAGAKEHAELRVEERLASPLQSAVKELITQQTIEAAGQKKTASKPANSVNEPLPQGLPQLGELPSATKPMAAPANIVPKKVSSWEELDVIEKNRHRHLQATGLEESHEI